MNINLDLLSGELATRLLTTLGHSLWQGAVATALLYIGLRLLPARRVQARYLAGLACLALLALAPLATWSVLSRPVTEASDSAIVMPDSRAVAATLPDPEINAVSQGDGGRPRVHNQTEVPWRALLAVSWLFGVATGLARLFGAVAGARRLRRTSAPADLGEFPWLAEQLAALGGRLRLRRRVGILLNPNLVVPAVCGLFRPVILVPTALLTGLPPAHLEAVLAHELAHIRRHDYFVNLLQMTLEALLFFNPFVWWISRQVRLEREAACDALAISATGAPADYARILAQIAERALAARPVLGRDVLPPLATPAMSGPRGDRGQLIERVRRVLRPGDRPGLRLSLPATITFLALSFVVLIGLHYTTAAAVNLLTPQERIDKVAEIQKEYRPYVIKKIEERAIVPSDRKITVSGRLVTADGKPVPSDSVMYSYRETGNNASSSSISIGADGKFSEEDLAGKWTLKAYVPGYAMANLDLGQVNDDRKDVILNLERGFTSTLLLTDTGHRPLPGVKVAVSYGYNGPVPTEYTSGPDGRVELLNRAQFPQMIEADLSGYEHGEWTEINLEPEKVRELVLDKSIPVTGRIVAADTGLPLAGVDLKIAFTRKGQSSRAHSDNGPVLATSKADGSFVLDTLRSDTSYSFLLTRPGYLWHLIQRVAPGDAPHEVKLQPAPQLKLLVKGLEPERKGKVELYYSVTLAIPGFSAGTTAARPVAAPVNGEAQFTFPVLMNAETTFGIGNHTREVTWEELNQGTLIWDLAPKKLDPSAPEQPVPLQAVEVILKTPAGLPKANGQLVITHRDPKLKYASEHIYEVKDGIAKLAVPVPNDLNFGPEGINGYWFRAPFEMKVEAQPEPVRFEIEAFPAGAIYGTLALADGSPGRGIMLWVIADPAHQVLKGNNSGVTAKDSSSSDDDSSRFYAGPLPFGGKFMIGAGREASYVFTKPLPIDEKTPIHEIKLQFPPGETVRGQVLAADGTPIRGAAINMRLETTMDHNLSREAAVTGRQGEFEIPGMNPDVPGTYWLEVNQMEGYQATQAKVEFGKANIIRVKPGHLLHGIVKEVGTGKVIPGAEVYASRPDYDPKNWPSWINAGALADENGRFHFTDLPEGQWQIHTRSGNQVGESPVVTAGAAEEVILEIKLMDSSLKPVDAPK